MLLNEQAEQAAQHATLPRWVLTVCGELRCALAAARAHEIVDAPALTRVPGAGAHVVGLMNLRGRPVTVFDLARALQPDGTSSDTVGGSRGQIIVMRDEGRLVGLRADAVLAVAPVAMRDELSVPESVDPAFVAGAGKHAGETFLGLDTSALLSSLFD